MLLQVAIPKKTEYEFIQIQKCKSDKNGIPSVRKFKMVFEAKACKPRPGYRILMFSHCHIKSNKIDSKAKFGGSVAYVISIEQPAIKIATRIVVSVRNYVVHVWHFQCEIGFSR